MICAGLLGVLTSCEGRTLRLGNAPRGDASPCDHATIKASEVAWLGDSWVTITGAQHTRVRDLARAAKAIGPSDDYLVNAAAGATMAIVSNQYATVARTNQVKVLIMDGGTFDQIIMGASDTVAAQVLGTLQQLFARIASDGTVAHIIYFVPPALPTIVGLANVKPGLVAACATSAVPCHFLDLDEVWQGHGNDYTDQASGIQASAAGSLAIAEAIWKIMQDNCIAQ